MKRLIPAVFLAQKLLLSASYWFHRLTIRATDRGSVDWVVGPDELASVVFHIRRSLPSSFSVSFMKESIYDFEYDYRYRAGSSRRMRAWRKLFFGPLLLGRLLTLSRGFLYVGASGFLIDSIDHRDFEFRYLKRKGAKLGIYWCGSEIRSTRIMHEMEERTGLPNISTYIGWVSPYYETDEHERIQQARARVGDAYADVMFDFPTDQAGYLTQHREPYLYLMPDDRIVDDLSKFDDLSTIVVTHATTSPIIKGTQLVRSAVARLKSEGYEFEYVELMNLSNTKLLAELARTHIALNQFFGFTTTIFGVEAMAAGCALLASSDATVETNLPPRANDAMMVTKHWQVYQNLKSLLDEPERIKPLAVAGQEWVKRYATSSSTGPILKGILDSVLDGSYDVTTRRTLTVDQIYNSV